MNNFDSNKNHVGLELACSYDNDLSYTYFSEEFERDNDRKDTFHFISYGTFEPLDLSDRVNYKATKAELKESILSLYDDCEGVLDSIKEDFTYYIGGGYSRATKSDLFDFIEYLSGDIAEFYMEYLTPLFELLPITGYSQGDYSEVVFSNKAIEGYTFKDREKFLSEMTDHFSNLFYNAPVYCRLDIGGGDHDGGETLYIDQELQSAYDYSKEEAIEIVDKLLDHTEKKYILDWLESNIPEHPDYT